eukprot:jgi/Galph1/2625/GphlegSOOS_G1286.1
MTSLPIPIFRRSNEESPSSQKCVSPRWEVRAVRTPTGRRKHFYVDHENRATYWNMPKEDNKNKSSSMENNNGETVGDPVPPPPPPAYEQVDEFSLSFE